MEEIIPNVVRSTPGTNLPIATNSVDVLTYATHKLSGFPASRIIRSGTLLDLNKLKCTIGRYYGISSDSVEASIIGYNKESLYRVFEHTRDAACRIIKRKGYIAYGIAAALTRIVEAILRDEGPLLTVSIVGNYYGVKDVALSAPTKIGRDGAHQVMDSNFEPR